MKSYRTFFVLLSVFLANKGTMAFTCVPRGSSTTRVAQTSTQLAAWGGNAYLNALEQQTIVAANATEAAPVNPPSNNHPYVSSLHQQHQPPQAYTNFDSFDGPAAAGVDSDDDGQSSLMTKIKEKGKAGIISFAMVQTGFWSLSFVVALAAYVEVTGHLPDFADPEEMSQLGSEAFAYVNVARLAAPLRAAIALSSSSWVQENVLDRWRLGGSNGEQDDDHDEETTITEETWSEEERFN